MEKRVTMGILGLLIGTLLWLIAYGRTFATASGTPTEAKSDVEAEADNEEEDEGNGLLSLFSEMPETDNPEVVRLYLAWRLAEQLVGNGRVDGQANLDRQLKLFGTMYKKIVRATK